MSIKNIVWLIPDGVRTVNYNDPFGRFEFFDTLADEGFCEFKNMYTSHPSTFMSFSSFLRGIYATKVSKTYGELKSLRYEVETIDKKLTEIGLNIYFLTFYPDDLKDQVNSKIIDFVKDKDRALSAYYQYKNGTIFDDDYVEEYNEYIKYFLENEELKEPFFLLIHVNVPLFKDPIKYFNYDYNKYFEEVYHLTMKKIDRKTTTVIINSDHGYPFYEENKEYNFSHDEAMTQENLKSSFFISHPQIKEKEVFDNTSLTDIYPTICDIFNLDYPKHLDGISLFKTIKSKNKNKDRVIRVENRFPLQNNAKVALIKDNYKLIFNRNNSTFDLFEINPSTISEKIITDEELVKEYISLFHIHEEEFTKNREILIESSKKLKDKKIESLLKDKKNLFIKSIENEYIELFIDNYSNKEDIIISLKDINLYLTDKVEQVIFLVKEVLSIDSSILGEELNSLCFFNDIPLYIIDSYHNLEECEEDIESMLLKKHKIFVLKNKKKNRSENERNKIREAFQLIYKQKVRS